jgi:hypothetical protein
MTLQLTVVSDGGEQLEPVERRRLAGARLPETELRPPERVRDPVE